jgi:hypothetical protein
VKKEFGPSQSAAMLHGLTEAAEEFRRNELVLTPRDAQFLEDTGVAAPARMDEYFRCVVCDHIMREDIEFLILQNGDIACADHAAPRGPELVR